MSFKSLVLPLAIALGIITPVAASMAVEYLNPLSAVFPAIYSVCQNLFNSWQMWQYEKTSHKT